MSVSYNPSVSVGDTVIVRTLAQDKSLLESITNSQSSAPLKEGWRRGRVIGERVDTEPRLVNWLVIAARLVEVKTRRLIVQLLDESITVCDEEDVYKLDEDVRELIS